MKWMQNLITLAVILVLTSSFAIQPAAAQSGGGGSLYLPAVMSSTPSPAILSGRSVNIPFINKALIGQSDFPNTAIFWYGAVTADNNSSDVRIAYTSSELFIYMATFDRRIWFNQNPSASELEAWDALTVRLYTGSAAPGAPDANSYRLVTQFYDSSQPERYQAAYRGQAGSWASAAIPYTTTPNWRGDGVNTNVDDRGWGMIVRIPFSSLGLQGMPLEGTLWRLSLQTHDRDSAGGGGGQSFSWPEAAQPDEPNTWGNLRFGIPQSAAPAVRNPQTVEIRRGLNAGQTPDADVGGGSTCGAQAEPDFFSSWGGLNHAGHGDFNIQNQADIADWPCYSRYYVQFPLDALPQGKVIRSARLILHQFGGSNPEDAIRSNIQVMTVGETWDENTLTWNNAPLALENLGSTWVNVLPSQPAWPGAAYEWDVTRGAAQAYQNGNGLGLVLYSADAAYHSGKYFTTSEAEDWNAAARPTLVIEYGDP